MTEADGDGADGGQATMYGVAMNDRQLYSQIFGISKCSRTSSLPHLPLLEDFPLCQHRCLRMVRLLCRRQRSNAVGQGHSPAKRTSIGATDVEGGGSSLRVSPALWALWSWEERQGANALLPDILVASRAHRSGLHGGLLRLRPRIRGRTSEAPPPILTGIHWQEALDLLSSGGPERPLSSADQSS